MCVLHLLVNFGSAEGSTLPPVTEHNISNPREESNSTNSSIVCSEDFYLDSGVCKPQCGQWIQHPRNTVVTFQILLGVATSFGLTAASLVLIVSCIRYKKVWVYGKPLHSQCRHSLHNVSPKPDVGSSSLLSSLCTRPSLCMYSVYSYWLDTLTETGCSVAHPAHWKA